ncbi:DUF6053 domain-containing protein [Lysobacter enzymogenes]|uniref:DUF6053 domain-containing protein n=1 Tax=Lysobacter enzymogenes TaxID=69 RepID=UPI003D18A993
MSVGGALAPMLSAPVAANWSKSIGAEAPPTTAPFGLAEGCARRAAKARRGMALRCLVLAAGLRAP